MAKKLEVCTGNARFGSHAVARSLCDELESYTFAEVGCLGYCHRCFRVPFAMVDERENIEAPDASELAKALRARLGLSHK
ncbi:MAG: DUF1450 domain-containing protein [Firmicutes bacterium]|nr:DUF1450 domain-containing protein [Bacillota bacterium]